MINKILKQFCFQIEYKRLKLKFLITLTVQNNIRILYISEKIHKKNTCLGNCINPGKVLTAKKGVTATHAQRKNTIVQKNKRLVNTHIGRTETLKKKKVSSTKKNSETNENEVHT